MLQLTINIPFVNRNHLPIWLQQNGLKIICEVGVLAGANLLNMLKSGPENIYGVDKWLQEDTDNAGDFKANQAQLEEMYNRLKQYETVVPALKLLRMDSLEAARQFDDQTFDFVYIDANHRYECVKKDIEAWWPKVKTGRYLGGHDYALNERWGVIQAVHEFIGKHELQNAFYTTHPHEQSGDTANWFIQKVV